MKALFLIMAAIVFGTAAYQWAAGDRLHPLVLMVWVALAAWFCIQDKR